MSFRLRHLLLLSITLLVIVLTPWFTAEKDAAANAPLVWTQGALEDAVALYGLLAGQDPEYILPQTAVGEEDDAGIHVVPLGLLVNLYTHFMKQPPPAEVPLRDLTAGIEGWKPLFLPIDGRKIENQILISAGIIDLDLINRIRDEIAAYGFDYSSKTIGEGYVVFIRENTFLPSHYPTQDVVVDWGGNQITQYPLMELESELNIPAYSWRIWHKVNGQRHLIADWPVVVGKYSTRTRLADLPMDMVERYPPWTDPETGQHVEPGPGNPLGLWKLKSTHTKRLWYYHGTDKPHLVKHEFRAFSHGCVRNDNDNIRRLSWLLLTHDAGNQIGPDTVEGRLDMLEIRRFRRIKLISPVMSKNVYDTIEIKPSTPLEESVIAFYPDIYYGRKDVQAAQYKLTTYDHLIADLKAAGMPVDKLDQVQLQYLVNTHRKRVRTPIFVKLGTVMAENPDQKNTAGKETKGASL